MDTWVLFCACGNRGAGTIEKRDGDIVRFFWVCWRCMLSDKEQAAWEKAKRTS